MKKAITIITNNTDTFTNPVLVSVIEKLILREYEVLIFLPVGSEEIKKLNVRYYQIPSPFFRNGNLPRHPIRLLRVLKRYMVSYLDVRRILKEHKVEHVIAVDPVGLIVTGNLKRILKNVYYHYFSFEIFFSEEIAKSKFYRKIKKEEIKYSKNLASVVIQDERRKELLKKENKIKNTNWFKIPVAPASGYGIITDPSATRNGLKIPEKTKVIVHSGSLHRWSGVETIISALKSGIPDNYIILIHSRFPFDMNCSFYGELSRLQNEGYPVILHDKFFNNYSDYCSFLSCFNFGLALYYEDKEFYPYTGKNIAEIGLASGKFSTYMMLGLPTVTTVSESFCQLNDEYKFGYNIRDSKELMSILKSDQLDLIRSENCRKLYNEKLNPDNTINKFIDFLA